MFNGNNWFTAVRLVTPLSVRFDVWLFVGVKQQLAMVTKFQR